MAASPIMATTALRRTFISIGGVLGELCSAKPRQRSDDASFVKTWVKAFIRRFFVRCQSLGIGPDANLERRVIEGTA